MDLLFDAKVITVYGDQEGAAEGYNPHKNGRKSYHMKVCTIEPFGFILAIRLEPGNAVSNTDFSEFYRKCIPDDSFEPFYPGGGIEGASFNYCMTTWEKSYEFVVVRKFTENEDNGQGMLFPKWRYQIICHNQQQLCLLLALCAGLRHGADL